MTASPGEAYGPSLELEQTPQTFDEAFRDARNELYQVGFEPDFQDLCKTRGLDPLNIDHPNDRNPIANEGGYAATVSDYMHRKLDAERQRLDYNGDRIVPERALVVRELAASTADFAFSQLHLKSLPKEPLQDTEQDAVRQRVVRGAVRLASHYNGLIRKTAAEFPDITPSELTDQLTNLTNTRFQMPGLIHNAPDAIKSAVRGAKYEAAHGQLLRATGAEVRDSTVREDLKGADFSVTRPDSTTLLIDAKASPWSLRNMNVEGSYGYNKKGVLVVCMLTEKEIGDSFTLSDELIVEKVPVITKAINAPVPQLIDSRSA